MPALFHPRGPSFFELARQGLSSTTRGYDLLAEKFDYTSFRTPDVVLCAAANLAGPPESVESILDLCCGTGAAMAVFRKLATKEIIGVDLSQGMLDVAKKQVHAAPGTANIELIQADALAIDFDRRFDIVVSFGAFGHILPPDQPRFLDNIARALKPGGRFIFATAPMPAPLSRAYLLSRAFNAAMHLRNALIRPPFIMFYLLFTLEQAEKLLQERGFALAVHHPFDSPPLQRLVIVEATYSP